MLLLCYFVIVDCQNHVTILIHQNNIIYELPPALISILMLHKFIGAGLDGTLPYNFFLGLLIATIGAVLLLIANSWSCRLFPAISNIFPLFFFFV